MSRSAPIVPARIGRQADGTPWAEDFGDVYHAAAGALAQARHVFLGGNGLPARWAGQARHVILETGFGLGNNFLATWAAWRDDPARCERLVFLSVEKHPPTRADLAEMHRGHAEPELAAQLLAAWPPLSPDLHLLDFEAGRVRLLLAFGDAAEVLPGLQAEVDSVYLDGFAPAKNGTMWSPELLARIGRLAAPGARAATWSAARAVREGLAAAGFEVGQAPGFAGKRDMTLARHAPRHVPAAPRGWARPRALVQAAQRHALVIGAGLAGCACAAALAREGWRSTLIDRHRAPASEASGNAGGLMHPIFNAPDSLHARWFRAAAQATARAAAPALARGELAGELGGFLRLEPRLDGAAARQRLGSVGLPAEQVDWAEADTAAALAGLPLAHGAWHFGAAGWLEPAGWARTLLAMAGDAASWRGGTEVARLQPPGAEGEGWTAFDAAGRVIAQAPVIVLANALDAARLLPEGALPPRLGAVRGQVTRLPAGLPGLRAPRLPLSGQGYALTLPGGEVLVGATTQHEAVTHEGAALRAADEAHNLARAAALGVVPAGLAAPGDAPRFPGRAGWRAVTPDRLPLVGPVVDRAAEAALRADSGTALRAGGRARLDAPRHRPRQVGADHGLYLCTGLGSRGITSAWLAGQLLAAWVTGAPMPVETALRDALDPARQG